MAANNSLAVERNNPIEQTVSQETVRGCPEYVDSPKACQRNREEQGKHPAQDDFRVEGRLGSTPLPNGWDQHDI